MTRKINRLTKEFIDSISTKTHHEKYCDGDNLYLWVYWGGRKVWYLKYKFDGKDKLLSLPEYPDLSIEQARALKKILQEQIKNGIDPKVERENDKKTIIEAFKKKEQEYLAEKLKDKHNYRLKFSFKADHREECPFRERISSYGPNRESYDFTRDDLNFCRIFGYMHKCEVSSLGDADYPKWCPIEKL